MSGSRPKDLTGMRFGRLVAVEATGHKNLAGNYLWSCECDCGARHAVTTASLMSGKSRSCGCLKRERTGVMGRNALRHGHATAETPEYRSWHSMKTRCSNPNTDGFEFYGGRGITVCERWHTFENFLADMGPRPSTKHSLDRYPNNDGDYEPGNCRWATKKEQAQNRRAPRRAQQKELSQ